jgi:ATP/maltotriose-dependent transcriptional regulator MalT
MEAAISLLIMADIARLAGDLDEAGRLCEECVARLARMPSAHPARGHGRALLSAVSAKLDLELGDVAAARAHLADSYRIALTTRDMPVVAATGVAVSRLAREVGRYADAAQILGAAARLRGSEDPTQPDIARQLRDLRRLSPTFDQDYAAGRELSGDAARARLDPGRLD